MFGIETMKKDHFKKLMNSISSLNLYFSFRDNSVFT